MLILQYYSHNKIKRDVDKRLFIEFLQTYKIIKYNDFLLQFIWKLYEVKTDITFNYVGQCMWKTLCIKGCFIKLNTQLAFQVYLTFYIVIVILCTSSPMRLQNFKGEFSLADLKFNSKYTLENGIFHYIILYVFIFPLCLCQRSRSIFQIIT